MKIFITVICAMCKWQIKPELLFSRLTGELVLIVSSNVIVDAIYVSQSRNDKCVCSHHKQDQHQSFFTHPLSCYMRIRKILWSRCNLNGRTFFHPIFKPLKVTFYLKDIICVTRISQKNFSIQNLKILRVIVTSKNDV